MIEASRRSFNGRSQEFIDRENALVRRICEARYPTDYEAPARELYELVRGASPATTDDRARPDQMSPPKIAPGVGGPSAALVTARVDLVDRIRTGIAEREWVPGAEWLIRGKRYLIFAPAGLGKSLALLVAAIDVIEAGGTVAILDVENGDDEYARRLADVLKARDDGNGALVSACSERLRYYAWPALRADWSAGDWAAAMAGLDLAIFDSSRLTLSAAGLTEDSNDDYAIFVSALLVPLARAGTTTVVLDNTGHAEGNRARGASAKADLNEVVYALKPGSDFDRDRLDDVRLERHRTRFAEQPRKLHMPLGGGTYGPVEVADDETEDGFRPTRLMERASQVIEGEPGLSTNQVAERVKGKRKATLLAIGLLVEEQYVRREIDGRGHRHYSINPYTESDER